MPTILKTPKCYVGGAFIRSESACTYPLNDGKGNFVAHIPQCTRKDLRNAVEAAAKATAGWAKRTGYNRGQILYRLAEMLEARRAEFADAIALRAPRQHKPETEVATAIDRIVHYAGWTDKYEQLLGSVNPVAAPYFNFTVTEPMGIIGVIAPDDYPLLGLLTYVLPAITSGNSVVALASTTRPYPSILLGEVLATSDLPGGVVNLLTGFRKDLVPTFATHAHLRAVTGIVNAEERRQIEQAAADTVKRVHLHAHLPTDNAQGLQFIADLVEYKTTWHPIGS